MMRGLMCAAALLSLAAPARAALPPHYYEEARRTADTVVVIEVDQVSQPPMTQGFGDCMVSGRVIGVERGAQYRVGAHIRLTVPCRFAGAPTPVGPVLYREFEALQRTRYGRAYLEPGGRLALSQYDLLNSWTGPLPQP